MKNKTFGFAGILAIACFIIMDFSDNVLGEESDMRLVKFAGTRLEIGKQTGAAFRDTLRQASRQYVSWPADRLGKLDCWIATVVPNMQKLCPEILQELSGIAEGARLDYQSILRCTLAPEAQWFVQSCCSQIALGDGHGKVMLGKTEDAGPNLNDYLLAEIQPEGRNTILHIYNTCWSGGSCGGLNQAGLAITQSSGNVELAYKADGVPRLIMLRLALERFATVAEAAVFLEGQHGCLKGLNFTLVDASGDMAVVEHAPGRRTIRKPVNHAIYATNHFVDPGMREVEWQARGAELDLEYRLVYEHNTLERYSRLADFAAYYAGKPDLMGALERILSSHGPGAICQHGNIMQTTWAVIIDPKAKELWLRAGSPCRGQFNLHKLTSKQ